MSINIPSLSETAEDVTGVTDNFELACRMAGCKRWTANASVIKRDVRSGSKEELKMARTAIVQFFALTCSAAIRDATYKEKYEFLRTVLFGQTQKGDDRSVKAASKLLIDLTDGKREFAKHAELADAVAVLKQAADDEYNNNWRHPTDNLLRMGWGTKGFNTLTDIRNLCEKYLAMSIDERYEEEQK